MKNVYLCALLLITGFSIKAQYVLTQASYPAPGDIDVQHQVTNTVVALGSSGTGQTWNYSGLGIQWSSPSTSTYVSMSSVPNASLFPTGTIGVDNGFSNYDVYENTSAASRYLGGASPTVSLCNVWSNPATFFTLPFGFSSSSYDTFGFNNMGDVLSGTITTTGDGTGTLLTPGMSFSNVLKVRQVVSESYLTGGITYLYNGIGEIYYSSGNKFPFLSISNGTSSSTSSTVITVSSSAQISRFAFVGIQENIKETDFSIYPNPVSNHEVSVNFSSNQSDNYSIKIMNAIGQEIKSIELSQMAPGEHSEKIELADLKSGIYFIKLKTKSSESIRKLVIE